MIEIFKTNINDPQQANRLLRMIVKRFTGYIVSFDLEDCDRILRVQCVTGPIQSSSLILFLEARGCMAEILPG